MGEMQYPPSVGGMGEMPISPRKLNFENLRL
jgi:hypothetical protein